jgi:hypothetical protein
VAANGPVSTRSVTDALSPAEQQSITLGKDVTSAVCAILIGLCQAGHAYTPGRAGFERRWSIPGISPQPEMPLDATTTSDRVLAHVTSAVARLDRPVRLDDVADEAEASGGSLTRSTISYTLLRLAKSGRIAAVGRAIGGGGRTLYVPAGHRLADATEPVSVMTDGDRVLAALKECWRDNLARAEAEGFAPKPVLPAELHHRMAKGGDSLSPERTRCLLKSMARGKSPPVITVRSGRTEQVAWMPREHGTVLRVDTSAPHISARSTVRAVEALARACERLQLPLASSVQVRAEVRLDHALRPTGKTSVARALESASRAMLNIDRKRISRSHQRVISLGRVGGSTFYALADREHSARAHMGILAVEALLVDLRPERQIQELEMCEVPILAQSRAIGLKIQLSDALDPLHQSAGHPAAEPQTMNEAERLETEIIDLIRRLEPWAGIATETAKAAASVPPPLWSPAELFHAIRPIRPDLVENDSERVMNHRFGFTVRRIRNPAFITRQHPDRHHSVLWYFDRTHALLRFARENGGSECLRQAILVGPQLGDCREPQIILPVLASGTLDERLVAAACLGFLWSAESRVALRTAALLDPEPGVRQVALWAYGFSQGQGAAALLHDRATSDRSALVTDFAYESLATMEHDPRGWWAL